MPLFLTFLLHVYVCTTCTNTLDNVIIASFFHKSTLSYENYTFVIFCLSVRGKIFYASSDSFCSIRKVSTVVDLIAKPARPSYIRGYFVGV